MEGVLDQGMQRAVIKLARSSNWVWPYGPFIKFAFGISPNNRDPLGAYQVLIERFQKRTPEEKDIIYLWECLAEYSIIAYDILSELGIPDSQIRTMWLQWIENLSTTAPADILDLTISCVSLMGDCFNLLIHDEDYEPSCLQMVRNHQCKIFTVFFRAVLKAHKSRKVTDEVQVVRTLRQLSEYLGRVKSESRVEVLQKNDLKKYIEQEHDMDNWVFDEELLSEIRTVISNWYPEQLWNDELSNFSPILSAGSPYGSTRREGGNAYYKYNMFALNTKVAAWQTKYGVFNGIPRFTFTEHDFSAWEDYGLPARLPANNPYVQRAGHRSFVCELVYVPKTAKKLRTISKEAPYLSYLQHGVQHMMVKIGRKTDLRYHVDYKHADYSAEMAREGSLNGFYDTLDLSAASDSVHVTVIKLGFPTYMRDALMATRSDYVQLPNKEILYMNKFAPMGSATCFPVETTVFAAVCEVAKKWCRLPEARYRVYGDDIVCDHRLTATIEYILDKLHFKVNQLKSFTSYTTHTFREACGGEFCNGFDVKPVRVSRQRYSVFAMSSENIRQSYIDMMHETWYYYRRIARLLYRRLDLCVVSHYAEEGILYTRYHKLALSKGLPWDHIKEHPVYNPVIDGDYRSATNRYDYERCSGSTLNASNTLVFGEWERCTANHRPVGLNAFGYEPVNEEWEIPFYVDGGLAALWTWLARAERRPEQNDITNEFRGISLPFLMSEDLIEPDDAFSNPLLAKDAQEEVMFAFSRRDMDVTNLINQNARKSERSIEPVGESSAGSCLTAVCSWLNHYSK